MRRVPHLHLDLLNFREISLESFLFVEDGGVFAGIGQEADAILEHQHKEGSVFVPDIPVEGQQGLGTDGGDDFLCGIVGG